MGDDDQPHLSSCSGATASSSGGSSSSLSPAPPPLPPPFPCSAPSSISSFPQQQQQLLQQLQLQQLQQQQQQQRLFSLHLAPGAASPSLPLKHPLPVSSSPVPPPAPVPSPAPGCPAPSDRHSRDDCWSDEATFTLIQAWGDRYLELNRGNLKQKHWRDVADAVNRRVEGFFKAPKTDIQCKNRIDTLKKKYKLEKSRISVAGQRKWAFFDRLDELLGNSKKPKKPLPVKPRASAPPLLTLPAKRTFEDADQAPQFHPSFVVAAPNHWPSPAANHVTSNHAGRAPNHHGTSASNYLGSTQDRAAVVPYHPANNSNHGGSAHHLFGSNANHLASAVDATSKSKDSPHTADSCRNGESSQLKRLKHHTDPMHDLAQAITKFGEVYERTEIARQQMSAEIEKQRMIFAKDLELQRLQFFTQTQVELAKLRLKFRRGQTDNC